MTATYTPAPLSEYAGNPLIEALPPIVRSDEDVMKAMAVMPQFSESERSLAPAIRREIVLRLKSLFIPLPTHFDLYERLATCVRRSYTWRNPLSPATQTHLHRAGQGLSAETMSARAAAGSVLFVKGISGVGKSTGLEACLRALGPNVIQHVRYGDVPLLEKQIVWLKISCPEDRSTKSLCIEILSQIDIALGGETSYIAEWLDNPRATIGSLKRVVMQALAAHHIGVLVVDELQNLFGAKGQPASELLNFLLRVRDESGVCLTLSGTYASLHLLQSKFRLGRRVAADGVMEMLRPARPNDFEWESFCEILWGYQWVGKPIPYKNTLAATLFRLTVGIRGLAVPLMMRAQVDAIAGGSDHIDAACLRRTWHTHFSSLDRPLAALRSNDPKALAEWDDLCDSAALKEIHTLGGGRASGRATNVPRVAAPNKATRTAAAAPRGVAGMVAGPADADLEKLHDPDGLKTLRKMGVVGVE